MRKIIYILSICVTLAGCGDPTRYSGRYSEERFDRISIGMDLGQAIELLGEPLEALDSKPGETWAFGASEKVEGTGIFGKVGGNVAIVSFDASGRVFSTNADVRSGMNRDEVVSKLGKPDTSFICRDTRRLHFSQPEGWGTYHARIVGFGPDGKVAAIYRFDSSE